MKAVVALLLVAAFAASVNAQAAKVAPKKVAPINPKLASQREVCTVKGQAGSGVCLIAGNCNKHIAKNKAIKYLTAAQGSSVCPKNQGCCFTPAPVAVTPTPTAPAVPPKPVTPPSECDKISQCIICTRKQGRDGCMYDKKNRKCMSDKLPMTLGRINYAKQFWAGGLDAREYPLEYECKNDPIRM